MDGQTALIKQCMPVNERIVVERLTEDDVKETLNPGSATLDQTARFYPGKVRKYSLYRPKQIAQIISEIVDEILFISYTSPISTNTNDNLPRLCFDNSY